MRDALAKELARGSNSQGGSQTATTSNADADHSTLSKAAPAGVSSQTRRLMGGGEGQACNIDLLGTCF
jgi:hypothetical protein